MWCPGSFGVCTRRAAKLQERTARRRQVDAFHFIAPTLSKSWAILKILTLELDLGGHLQYARGACAGDRAELSRS